MNETDFQALFDSYQEAIRGKQENPIPKQLHLMVYNYARLRHQQTSDVSADFYLHALTRLEGILNRYNPKIIPFYQYLAMHLNFEFNHFLRRRKLPRNRLELLSVEELAARRVELQYRPAEAQETLDALFDRLEFKQRLYAKLALACPLTIADLRQIIHLRKSKDNSISWGILRGYRQFLKYVEEKRVRFVAERDRLLKALVRVETQEIRAGAAKAAAIAARKESARRKFFSMDTRIPVRIVATVTGDPIATVQRQLKKALATLKSAHIHWEKQNLLEKQRT
jgi:hypothetical protein